MKLVSKILELTTLGHHIYNHVQSEISIKVNNKLYIDTISIKTDTSHFSDEAIVEVLDFQVSRLEEKIKEDE